MESKNQELNNYLDKVRKAIAKDNDIINLVKSIESGIKTTQNNYGKYLQILGKYNKNKAFCYGLALGLIDIGASKEGVNSALKVLYG
jgi:hypothetical protein